MSRRHIEVSELQQYASALRSKAEELRDQTQGISRDFMELVGSGAWNDSKSARFSPNVDQGTNNVLKLAARCDDYAAWLDKLASEVDAHWGEKMDVS
jgi:hypothetical protein